MFVTLREQEIGDLEQRLSGLEHLLCRHEVESPTPVFKGNTARHAHNLNLDPGVPTHSEHVTHTRTHAHTEREQ